MTRRPGRSSAPEVVTASVRLRMAPAMMPLLPVEDPGHASLVGQGLGLWRFLKDNPPGGWGMSPRRLQAYPDKVFGFPVLVSGPPSSSELFKRVMPYISAKFD